MEPFTPNILFEVGWSGLKWLVDAAFGTWSGLKWLIEVVWSGLKWSEVVWSGLKLSEYSSKQIGVTRVGFQTVLSITQ